MNDEAYQKELDFIKNELKGKHQKPSTRFLALIWLTLGIGIGALFFQVELSEALYSIPPTPAWTTIEINNNQIWPNNSRINITAQNYTDKFYIVSDGSILINITEFTP